MSLRRLGAFLAAALLGAAAGQVVPGPAGAASGYCAEGTGVTVVVDFDSLGGTSAACDPNGANQPGSSVMTDAGFALKYVQQQPGFVCQINSVPESQCVRTPPANAYWGLFWSDGKSGTWSYSSTGIGSLKVAAGGFIGWRFQNSSTRSNPGTAPLSPAGSGGGGSPKPTVKPSPGRTATSGPTSDGTTGGGTRDGSTATGSPTRGSAATSPSSIPSKAAAARTKKAAAAKARAKQSPTASPTATSSASATSTDGATESATGTESADADLSSGEKATGSGSALPLFAGGLLAVLLATAGTLAWRRRRS